MKAIFIITAGKESFGQGNVFTPVCHSVHGGAGVRLPQVTWWGSAYRRDLSPDGLPRGKRWGGGGWADPPSDTMGYGKCAGGTHPTGMHSCFIFYEIITMEYQFK